MHRLSIKSLESGAMGPGSLEKLVAWLVMHPHYPWNMRSPLHMNSKRSEEKQGETSSFGFLLSLNCIHPAGPEKNFVTKVPGVACFPPSSPTFFPLVPSHFDCRPVGRGCPVNKAIQEGASNLYAPKTWLCHMLECTQASVKNQTFPRTCLFPLDSLPPCVLYSNISLSSTRGAKQTKARYIQVYPGKQA